MQGYPWDRALAGWIHITSAAAVGGLFFVWLVGTASGQAEPARALVGRFRPFFWAAALLLPLSGAYTWFTRTGIQYPGFYFAALYAKIVLYVVLFGLAGMITSPRASLAGRRGVLAWCVALTLVILFLSAFMRSVIPRRVAAGTTACGLSVWERGDASGWQS